MLRHNQKGVALIEFAIVLPLLLLLVFGAIEFGLLLYNKQVITNASREGARAGITPIDAAGNVNQALIKKTVKDYCNKKDNTDTWKIINLNSPFYIAIADANVPDALLDANKDLTVTVTFNYPLLFAQIVGITNTTVSAQTVMRMEPAL
jgi:Flp pilus assembly protein TadG